MCQEFSRFPGFLNNFVFAKLATTSIRVKVYHLQPCIRQLIITILYCMLTIQTYSLQSCIKQLKGTPIVILLCCMSTIKSLLFAILYQTIEEIPLLPFCILHVYDEKKLLFAILYQTIEELPLLPFCIAY